MTGDLAIEFPESVETDSRCLQAYFDYSLAGVQEKLARSITLGEG